MRLANSVQTLLVTSLGVGVDDALDAILAIYQENLALFSCWGRTNYNASVGLILIPSLKRRLVHHPLHGCSPPYWLRLRGPYLLENRVERP